MRCTQLLLVSALAALCLGILPAFALLTTVGAGEGFTATEWLPPGSIVVFTFMLHPDYPLPVAARDRDTGEVLYEWKDRHSGVLNLPSLGKKRVLHFSFNNINSMFTNAYINFDIRLVADPSYNIDSTQLDPIESNVQLLFLQVQRVKGFLQVFNFQQSGHHATVVDTNRRLLLWSILQVVGFVVASGVQLYFLKLFLEKKRTLG
ncbi:hypothetical protein ABL78_7166 [Leptomonas seymouri]|uniref:GOLD domain-containing protein n=1 Tax=Leptomonas seymouri TaxID=5684 RepID=A0A0N1II77_LEPSE|nr:hypothetical protein ABL78_7166 [Leptomonas seymouri]|eukprot:KPI83784.1 hypothetical protein ABL78_7166 [Leptomonas seymouri]